MMTNTTINLGAECLDKLVRVSLDKNISRSALVSSLLKQAGTLIRKGFENQKEKKGVSFIEIVSNCNSGWKMTPVQSNQWLVDNMLPYYPLGDIKDI